MKRLITAMVFSIMAISGPVEAQEATLATRSMEEYESSLRDLTLPLATDAANALILQLVSLALGPKPDGIDGLTFLQEGAAKIAADPHVLLDGLKAYDGMTVEEIMAAKP